MFCFVLIDVIKHAQIHGECIVKIPVNVRMVHYVIFILVVARATMATLVCIVKIPVKNTSMAQVA